MFWPSALRIGGSNHHMSGATSGYPALNRSRRFDCGRSNPAGNEKLGNTTHVMFASRVTEWLMARSARYLVSVGGSMKISWPKLFSTGVDLCRSREKAKPISNLHYLLIADFPIGTAWYHLKKITFRTYRWCRYVTKL